MLHLTAIQGLALLIIWIAAKHDKNQKQLIQLASDPVYRAEREARAMEREARETAERQAQANARYEAAELQHKQDWLRARREAERLATLRGEKFTPWVEK